MRIETPDHFMGEPIPEDAIEIALANAKREKEGEALPLEGFIYVPSTKLYFAKEISHLGKEWYDTHIELQSKGLKMPTIPEFVEFLKYLRADPTAENTRVYKKIIEKRKSPMVEESPMAEWLDAEFYAEDDGLWVAYNHIVDSDGDLEAQNYEKLEGHLMQYKMSGISLEHWLNNSTSQGLPPENMQKGDLEYWYPRAEDVASFNVDVNGVALDCCTTPSEFDSDLGVRAVRTRAQNAGGKQ